MQTLFLEKNPFYILEVSPEDKRTIIIEKAEEKAFFTDNSLYENSQANLLNPAKRLTAEFDWFYDISNDKMSAIYENINSHTEIITDGMTGISKLNATLHNFSIAEYDDYFEIGYAILDIDEQYNNINLNTLTNIINSCREKAGINSITEADANDALNKKRKEISQLLDEKMQFLSNDDYIDLITMIAEKCIDDNYKDGIIISDVIDEYEIKKQADIEQMSEAILSHIDRIKNLANDEAIDENILGLIKKVKKWDRLVQPLQLKSSASGIEHLNSENIGYKIRELALYLNNNKEKTETALQLVNEMIKIFAELDNLSEIFENDCKSLMEIIDSEKETEKITIEIEALKSKADNLGLETNENAIESFISDVKSLNLLLKSSSLSEDLIFKVRENVGYIARSAAISLHNDFNQTSNSLKIIKAISPEFDDIPELSDILYNDLQTLKRQFIIQLSNKSQEKVQEETEKTKITIVLVVLGIIILIVLFAGFANCSSSQTNYKASETVFSQNCNSSDNVYIDIISIEPSIVIGTNSSHSKDVVCECKTDSGATVWVYMSIFEYNTYIDPNADITNAQSADFRVVNYSPERRIHGTARKADNLCDNLSKDTATMVLEFSSIEQVDN